MKNKIFIKMIHLEYLRLRSSMLLVFMVLAIFISIHYFSLGNIHYILDGLIILSLFLLPIITGLLLGSGFISEDIQNNTIKHILSLPVARHNIWLIRHMIRIIIFILFLFIWVKIHPLLYQIMFGRGYSGNTGSYDILLLTACLLFATGSVFSNLMENTFSSIIGGFTGGLILLYILRINGLSEAHMDKLLIFAIFYFIICSFDLFTCREPLNYRSLYKRAGIWIIAFTALSLTAGFLF